MRKQVLLHTTVLFAFLGGAGRCTLLELRDDSVCEGNPQYSQCGSDYPPDWCCAKSTTCLPVNSTTTVVVLCCPDGDDCASIQPIPCGVSNSSLSPVHILGEPPSLVTCGDGCCAPGYNCTSEICMIEPALGLIPTSLPRPTTQKTFGGGVGVGVGITLGIVGVACLIWFVMRRRRKEAPSLKSMISRPKQVAEEEVDQGERASLMEQTRPSGMMAYETGGQRRSDGAWRSSSPEMMPPPLVHGHTRTQSTTAAEQRVDVKQAMSKDLPPYPAERQMQHSRGDDKMLGRADLGVHPALRTETDTASSVYDRRGHGYGSGYDQR